MRGYSLTEQSLRLLLQKMMMVMMEIGAGRLVYKEGKQSTCSSSNKKEHAYYIIGEFAIEKGESPRAKLVSATAVIHDLELHISVIIIRREEHVLRRSRRVLIFLLTGRKKKSSVRYTQGNRS